MDISHFVVRKTFHDILEYKRDQENMYIVFILRD